MKVANDHVVTIRYTLTRQGNGETLDTTDEPMAYLHGHGNIMYALEMELEGKVAGEKLEVDLPAVQAYGVHREDFVERVPVKHLSLVNSHKARHARIKKGSVVRFRFNGEITEGTVVKMGKFNADVDMNHPLAGIDVHFSIEVLDVRAATAEEIDHGHAHGPGGHQH